jgi:hypothetical protein
MRSTSKVGEISTAQVLAALVRSGKSVLLPFGDHKRYDLVIEEQDGCFYRVQCKTGRIYRGSLWFATCSVDSRSGRGTIRRSYRGEITYFGVYCPGNNKAYLVPVDEVPVGEAVLRLSLPKNNQKSKIRWASQYEIGAVAQLGARVNGIHEVTGSIPVSSTPPADASRKLDPAQQVRGRGSR